MEILTARLSAYSQLAELDQPGEPASVTTAHGLLDIEAATTSFVRRLTVLREANLTGEEVERILFDIGEDFRHILYHLPDMKFYSYLNAPGQFDVP